ncbi:tudor domain-containing protein 5 isoform X2 [Aedes aegypti]|uniref:Uncharacterized protein n=1 Tax=Aedes aegypti TaxID=7159 RepID=A0A6I8U1R8_AEDAE|nr:tudor domain-containing protein 5 isoform X2 [Aedes aegypti]
MVCQAVQCGRRFVLRGQISGMWHRGKIVSDLAHNRVKVFYIDYGTVSESELKDVKFMAKCFSSMPAQAMRASLAYVKPVGHRWTRDACWSLLSLVYEKILFAYVVDINKEENCLDVVLIDTTGNKDSIINQQLFIKGHGIWEDDVPYKEKSKISASVRNHFRNFFHDSTN